MWKMTLVAILFVVLASCTVSLPIASEEDGLQTCEFVANGIINGEDYEEVILLENVVSLRDYGDFFIMESIDRRELNYAGGLIEKTFMNKSFDIDGETIAYRVINCQIQE
jgi:hypothetical protein